MSGASAIHAKAGCAELRETGGEQRAGEHGQRSLHVVRLSAAWSPADYRPTDARMLSSRWSRSAVWLASVRSLERSDPHAEQRTGVSLHDGGVSLRFQLRDLPVGVFPRPERADLHEPSAAGRCGFAPWTAPAAGSCGGAGVAAAVAARGSRPVARGGVTGTERRVRCCRSAQASYSASCSACGFGGAACAFGAV